MKYSSFKPKEIEPSILQFWKANEVVEDLRKRNKDGKKYYFLEGPPYTSGRIHLGHAWNMALKDMVLRYKRMNGFNVWDRMGYDMHGLPTEQKVMAKFELKDKVDIEKFGVEKFTQECKKFCIEMMEKMNVDFQRIGASLDFTNPYQPISNAFMQAEWWLISQAHKKGRLYRGLRTMHWDAATQTSVAKHELEYKNIKDTSIYVKLQSVDNPQHYFVVWTTTPWTIPLNLAIMVNPELDYVDVKVGEEIWTLAKSLHEKVLEKAKVEKDDYKLLGEYKGATLEGKKYRHPLNVKEHFPKELQENPKLYSILLSKEYVDDSAGTGLVHCAPGCGPEDYEVGHENKILPFNCVDEAGFFQNLGQFSGYKAKTDDVKFIQAIHWADALLAKETYVHDYPHGERSHEPVIFRTTKQWFFKVEDLKEQMLAANKKIKWNPEAGKNAFTSWLENLRDNSITKQRYWGTPVPIWINEENDDDYIVVENLKELEELSGVKVEEMHIPHIDDVLIKKNGKTYRRVPDVLDVWIDAGTTSWNCLDYPTNPDLLDQWFPVDFILEGKDQIRGWYNLLMVASMLALDKPSFKSVYMHGFVTDVDGVKMSKSIGNVISPYEVIDKSSVDTMRYYMTQNNAGEDINFSWDELTVKSRNMNIMWNLHKMLIDLGNEANINPFTLPMQDVEQHLANEEKFMLSRLESTKKEVTELMETYRLDEVITPLEELFLDLSRTYVQSVRDKIALGSREEKAAVARTMGKVFLEGIQMMQLVIPFICEAFYLNFKEHFTLEEKSLSHYMWPQVDDSKINEELERDMQLFASILQAALNTREKASLGLRWPVKEFVFVSTNPQLRNGIERLTPLLEQQLNAKKITVQEKMADLKEEYSANFAAIGKKYGKLTQKIAQEIKVTPAEEISKALGDGDYTFELEEQQIAITLDMLDVKHDIPDQYKAAEFKGGLVYLNTQYNDDLMTEGYAREIMRQVQSMRKDAGLKRADRIKLHIQTSLNMDTRLVAYTKDIKEKVGAEQIEISKNAVVSAQHTQEYSVKVETFTLSFNVL